ncbi:MAG: PspC domain-containing protein [Actinobacteria bacterium]|nr:PspC domain-containing protein [Actinomycetota bacterium]
MPENLPVISRPRDGAMVGGVCAGLARRWHLDPNLLRIAVVVLSIFGGLGLVAYGSALLLMPREGQAEMPVRRFLPFTRAWSTGTVVAVTIAAAVVTIAVVGSNGIGLGPVVVIFLIWFFGFRGRNQRTAPPPEPTPFERAAENWRQRLVEQQTPGYEASALASASEQRWTQPYTDPAADLAVRDDDLPAAVAPASARRPRRSWRLWWLALTLAGVSLAVVTVLAVVGVPTPPLAYTAAVLAGLGLTLLVAARRGRPPLLLPATLVMAAVTAGMMGSANHLAMPSMGEVHRTYTTGTQLPPEVTLSAGELTVDLTGLQLDADQNLVVHVGAGQLNLKVPDGVNTQVDWKVKFGEFNPTDVANSDQSQDGVDLSGSARYPASSANAPTLHVTASVDFGELDVTP